VALTVPDTRNHYLNLNIMNTPLIVKNTIGIHAPAAKVWDALVNPAQTKKYMFGCETVSDWKVGSELLWKGVFNGVEIVAVKGAILELQPEKRLVYTTIDPNGSYPDTPENYLTVTYTLSENNGVTTFTVTQGDYSKVKEGQKWYEEAMAGGGWQSILEEIKKLVEKEHVS
jgi:uncharacterized protein YndB with AHSA1/START domain